MPDNDHPIAPHDAADLGTTPAPPFQDSIAFTRCASCRHAAKLDLNAGAFICKKHNMRCNAESGAIPDGCLQYEQAE